MIQKINNINKKSFHNYSSKILFKQVNIIFGANGSGKTALSEWLNENSSGKAVLFDTLFVRDNILAEDTIKGIQLSVGKKAVDNAIIKNNIESANLNLNKIIEKYFKKIEKKRKVLYQILDDTLQIVKKEFGITKGLIHKRNSKTEPEKALKLWDADFKNAEDISNIPNSSQEIEDNIEYYRKLISALSIEIPFTKQDIDKLISILNIPLNKPDKEISQDVATWINEGLQLHNMDNKEETCLFCLNKFNAPSIKKIINKKMNTEYQNLMNELCEFENKIVGFKNKLESIPNSYKPNHKSMDEYTKIRPTIELLDRLNNKIEIKKEHSEFIISVNNEKFQIFCELQGELSEKISNFKKHSKANYKLLSSIETTAKASIGRKLHENKEAVTLSKDIENIFSKIKKIEENKSENQQWLDNREKISSNLNPFKDLVNKQLHVLGVYFKLDITNDQSHYLIKTINNNEEFQDKELRLKDLSEGEIRLLGFLYFYFKLFYSFNEENKIFKTNIETIIIDDPITSLDINNRYFITELINNLVKDITKNEHKIQIFIFTHSSLDFHNFGYNADKKKSAWLKILKNQKNESEITNIDSEERKNYSDYYKANFYDVFKFAITSKNKIPEKNYLSYGNKTRILLESHARTHYNIENVTVKNFCYLKKYYEISDDEEEEIKTSLDVINSLSHGNSFLDYNVIPKEVLQKYVRDILRILYKKDKFHVCAMAGKLINDSNKKEVLKWLS